MKVEFEDNKVCRLYEQLVENPEDRLVQKAFAKKFDKNITGAAIKLHQKIKSAANATVYNLTAGAKNKLELVSGIKAGNPVILKVRIQDSYRKLFYFYETNTQGVKDFCLTRDWTGQFQTISEIYVHDVNNHDYSKAK